jgi:K+-transporting ATPase ATPase C chain
MKTHLLISLKILGLCLILLGIVYPIIVFLAGQAVFPHQANGSLIEEGKRVIGSELVAQEFSLPQYFQPRPSAAAYDPSSSGGSNLAPTSGKLVAGYRNLIRALKDQNEPNQGKIPVELISMSASGLDPHISPGAALWQVPRIARVRSLSRNELEDLVMKNVQAPLFGFIGEWRVNVLVLNRYLDHLGNPKGQ